MGYTGPHPAQLSADLDPLLAEYSLKNGLGPLSVALEIAGERKALDYAPGGRRILEGPRPLFAVGCVLDMIVAVIATELLQQSVLSLEAPIGHYLPELAGASAGADGGAITVRHLFTRTSGIQDPRTIDEMAGAPAWDELSARVRQAPSLFSPGCAFNYGGVDRVILSAILERVTLKSLPRLAEEIIVQPCGIQHRADQLGPETSDGFRPVERIDTVHLATIVRGLAGLGEGRDGLFSAAARLNLQTEALPLSRSVRAAPWPHGPTGFTLGLFRYSDGMVGFNGWDRGSACAVRYDPTAEVAFVVAVEGPPGARDQIVAAIARRLGYQSLQALQVPLTIGGLNGLKPEQIVGDYAGWAEGYDATVRRHGDMVSCELRYRGHGFRQSTARLEEDAWLVVDAIRDPQPMEFFTDPATGRIGMSNGFSPYAKSAEGRARVTATKGAPREAIPDGLP